MNRFAVLEKNNTPSDIIARRGDVFQPFWKKKGDMRQLYLFGEIAKGGNMIRCYATMLMGV